MGNKIPPLPTPQRSTLRPTPSTTSKAQPSRSTVVGAADCGKTHGGTGTINGSRNPKIESGDLC